MPRATTSARPGFLPCRRRQHGLPQGAGDAARDRGTGADRLLAPGRGLRAVRGTGAGRRAVLHRRARRGPAGGHRALRPPGSAGPSRDRARADAPNCDTQARAANPEWRPAAVPAGGDRRLPSLVLVRRRAHRGPARARQYSSLFWNALEYLALFAIVLLHEFGHALACRQVGGRAEQIVLWPLGGVAYVDPPQRPGATLWSIAAGPLVNVVLAPLLIGSYWLAARARRERRPGHPAARAGLDQRRAAAVQPAAGLSARRRADPALAAVVRARPRAQPAVARRSASSASPGSRCLALRSRLGLARHPGRSSWAPTAGAASSTPGSCGASSACRATPASPAPLAAPAAARSALGLRRLRDGVRRLRVGR